MRSRWPWEDTMAPRSPSLPDPAPNQRWIGEALKVTSPDLLLMSLEVLEAKLRHEQK